MLKLTGYLVLLFCAAPLAAEEWLDFNARDAGFAGMGAAFGRDATGAYYNPANTARRPWETGSFPKFEIDTPFGVSAGLHGDSYNNIFQTIDLANELFDRFQDGAFDVSSTTINTDDLKFAMGVIDALDAINSLNGEGLYVGTSAGIAARLSVPGIFDLGELAAGLKPGRTSAGERTIAINLGIALDDMATAIRIYQRAVQLGLGTRLPF